MAVPDEITFDAHRTSKIYLFWRYLTPHFHGKPMKIAAEDSAGDRD